MRLTAYPAYKQTAHEWLASIPAHWSLEPLKRHARIVTGATPSSSNEAFWDGGIAWATPIDLTASRGRLLTTTARTISEAGLASCATELVPAGSVLLSTRAPIGTVAVAGIVTSINQGCRALVPGESVNSRFGAYILGAWADHLGSLGRGSTFLELSTDSLGAVQLPIPRPSEQTAIVTFLDRETAKIDALIAEQEQLIALLQEKRQAVISHAVTKGLDPNVPMKYSGVHWLGDVPAHWEPTRYKNVLQEKRFVSGAHLPAGSISFGRVVLKDDEAMNPATKASYQEVVRGEFLINPINLNYDLKSLRTALSGIDTCVSPAYLVLQPRRELDLSYFKHQLFVFDIRHMKTLGAGVRQTIGYGDIGPCYIQVPPLSEQRAISAFLDRVTAEIDALITEAESVILLLQERRTALITAAVTGQIDVRGIVETAA